MQRLSLLTAILLCSLCTTAQALTGKEFRADFEYFWTTVSENYCYWDKKKTDWTLVRTAYSPRFDTVTTRRSFVLLMEEVLNELYDHHASLSTNTSESQRLVPTGTDLWAEYVNGRPVITEVRPHFGAEKAGLRAGMEVVAVNGVSIAQAVIPFSPRCLKGSDTEAKNYALRTLLAGKHSGERVIRIKENGVERDCYPDRPANLLKQQGYPNQIESGKLEGNIGYIRINNCLGNNGMIPEFDSVLKTLQHTRALILDLRETPSGGNTTVARAILGSFLSKEGFYQKHEWTAEEAQYGIKRSWTEIVSPRKFAYTQPLVVLVNHWTGSVGEGMTIGFDALKRAWVVGGPMAGLNGAIYSYRMPNTGIGFSFPAEKLFHVNGLPREQYKPPFPVEPIAVAGKDAAIEKGLRLLHGAK